MDGGGEAAACNDGAGWWGAAPAATTDVMNQLCRVCGEPAAGFHFGAFTCEGCKSFFGRTYNNLGSISECKNNGECVINKKNRTSCKACRLRKCLVVGMSKSGSRYGRRSNWFKIHCLLQEQQQQQQQQQHQLQQHHQQPPPSPRLPQPVLPTPGIAKAKMLNLWGDMSRPGHLMDVDNNNASPATLQKMFLEKAPHPAIAATDALWRSSLLMTPHPPFLAPSFLPQPSRGFLLPFVQTLPLPLPPHVTAASSASSSSSSAASTPPPAPPPSLGPVQEQPIDLSLKGADRWDASDSDDASSEDSAKASPPAVKDTAPEDQAPRTRTTPLDLTTKT